MLVQVGLLVVVVMALGGCRGGSQGDEPGGSAPPSPEAALAPIGEIGGEPVPREAFVAWLLETHGSAAFAAFATERLVTARAAAAGVTVDDAAVAERAAVLLENLLAREPWLGPADALDAELGAESARALRARLGSMARTELLARELLLRERAGDEAALRAHFETVYGKDGVRPRVSHILVSNQLGAARGYSREEHAARLAELKPALRQRLEALREEALGGRPLAELAREHGDDRSGLGDGDLGTRWRGVYGPQLDAAVAALAPGAGPSPVLESHQGYHVVEVYAVDEGWSLELSVIRVAPDATDGRPIAVRQREAEARAREAAEVARAEGFEVAARRFSGDPRAVETGGSLGSPSRYDSFGPQAEAVLRALAEGEVSEPVLVGREWLVFRIDGRTRVPEEDVARVRHLMLSWLYPAEKRRQLGPQLEAAARARADAVLARLEAGEPFEEVARTSSDDVTTRDAGGRIADWRAGYLGAAADAALAALEPGEHSGAVASAAGLHVLRLDGEETTAFEAVREELREDLMRRGVSEREVVAYLRRLRDEAGVRYSP